eukprot:c54270_g1_i1 orf=188-355(+)
MPTTPYAIINPKKDESRFWEFHCSCITSALTWMQSQVPDPHNANRFSPIVRSTLQ